MLLQFISMQSNFVDRTPEYLEGFEIGVEHRGEAAVSKGLEVELSRVSSIEDKLIKEFDSSRVSSVSWMELVKLGTPHSGHFHIVDELARPAYVLVLMAIHLAWNQKPHKSYWIPLWFTLTGLEQSSQGDLYTGPGFDSTLPLISSSDSTRRCLSLVGFVSKMADRSRLKWHRCNASKPSVEGSRSAKSVFRPKYK